MFSSLKPPLEQRMFAMIWPRTEEVRAAIPPGHPTRAHPVVIQATTAIPNLAIAAVLLLRALPRERAEAIATKIEALMFEMIAADQDCYTVSEVLPLGSDQRVWQTATLGADPSWRSNLDTIFRAVHAMRIEKYQEECQKGFLMATENAGLVGEYGPLGFLAKRFLSDITGHPILRDNDLSEEGFGNLGLMSFYFATVFNALGFQLAQEIKR